MISGESSPHAFPAVLPGSAVLSFGYRRAVHAIEAALRGGLDPSTDPPRAKIPVGSDGTVLTMPSFGESGVGVKVVTHNPRNTSAAKPLVHGVYVHFDRDTMAPVAVLDGAALTTLRTPAVSLAGVRTALARFTEPTNVVVFGAGPQAIGHVDALCDTAADGAIPGPATITYVLRRKPDRLLACRVGAAVTAVPAGSGMMAEALRQAHVVVCATTSREPLFDSDMLGDRVVVIAVGSHDPDASEIDTGFVGRASVIVEDSATALRECGEVVHAIRAGTLHASSLIGIADVVTGRASDRLVSAPVLFKGSGMAWEDLVVARAIIAHTASGAVASVVPTGVRRAPTRCVR